MSDGRGVDAIGAAGQRFAPDERPLQLGMDATGSVVVDGNGAGELLGEPPRAEDAAGRARVVDTPALALVRDAIPVVDLTGRVGGIGPRPRWSNAAPRSWSSPRLKASGPRTDTRGATSEHATATDAACDQKPSGRVPLSSVIPAAVAAAMARTVSKPSTVIANVAEETRPPSP